MFMEYINKRRKKINADGTPSGKLSDNIPVTKDLSPDSMLGKVFFESVGHANSNSPSVLLNRVSDSKDLFTILRFQVSKTTGEILSLECMKVMTTNNNVEHYMFAKKSTDTFSGIILTDAQFNQIDELKNFYLTNGYLPTQTVTEIKEEEQRMIELVGKYQVLITHKPQGSNSNHTFTCSDYTDESTANSWCEQIWIDFNSGNKFITVIKIKENIKTRLNIDDLYELEVIKSEVYADRKFTPYWKM